MRQLFKTLIFICSVLTGLNSQTVDVYFDNLDSDANTVDIRYNSTIEVGGAQFDFEGGTLDDYSGGEANAAGWTVSGSPTTWIGFSFAGITIPAGDNVLIQISFTPDSDEICLSGVVFSDNAGNTIDVTIGECASLNEDEEDICNQYENQDDCEEMCCMWDEDSNSCSDEDDGPPECASDCNGYDEYPELACMEDICEFLELNEDSDCFDTCDEETFEFIAYFTEMCSEDEEEGCNDENALNFDPESDGGGDCYYDPFDEWIQSTTQSFYVVNELIVDGDVLNDDDSLYVIGAFCGENEVQVGSAQWDGAGTTIVVMGPDGVTEGTENYCFEGLETPVYIPADVPIFKVFNAVTGEMLDSQFDDCYDSEGEESDCTWANFGYNEIDALFAGEIEEIVGCMDDEAINFNPEANTDDDSCMYDPFDEWIQSTSQSFYDIQSLTVNGIELTADDSLFVIGAFCGDSVQVGSVQWTGAGTMIVVMGPDGVTEGTENYCFEGLETPVFIPADVPYYKVWDAENDEFLDASFEVCTDSQGYESDCAWANFGYNSIQNISAGEEPIEGCTDMDACNYDDQASIDCNGDNSCCEYADEHYDCDGNCENDIDGDEVCDELEVVGCMDDTACNYDDLATDEGECIYEEDCLGECGGTAEYDECGVCEGDGSTCVVFELDEAGIYSEEDCEGDLTTVISSLCDYEPFFGSEEDCLADGGFYISLPACYDLFGQNVIEDISMHDCMCGDGGEWDPEMEECISGTQSYNLWMEEIDFSDDMDTPTSLILHFDSENNSTYMEIYFDEEGSCEFDYNPNQEECEDAGAEWDDYYMECYIEDEDTCDELGGDWEEAGEMSDYSVEFDEIFFYDEDGEEMNAEITEDETTTSLTINISDSDCVFDDNPSQEDCENAGGTWSEYDMECEVADEDTCTSLNGEWFEICNGAIFSTDQSGVFGCTEQGNPYYSPEAIINDGSCSLNNSELITPEQYYLSENYPNPFNPTTQFSYSIPEYSKVDLSIYDIQGNLVKTIFNGMHKTGEFKVSIDGFDLASGVYLTVLNAGDVILSQKMILLK